LHFLLSALLNMEADDTRGPPENGGGKNTILNRLHQVLARVGVRSGPKDESPTNSPSHSSLSRSTSDEISQPSLHQHESLEVADGRVYQHALSQLNSSQPLERRLEVLDELSELVRQYKFEDPREIWLNLKDLIESSRPYHSKEKVINFIGALCSGDPKNPGCNFNRLGVLRCHFFAIAQNQGSNLGRKLQLQLLSHVTKGGQNASPFERETCDLLIEWLEGIATVQSDEVDHKFGCKLLIYSATFVKYNPVTLLDDQSTRLLQAVCSVCESNCQDSTSKEENQVARQANRMQKQDEVVGCSSTGLKSEVCYELIKSCLAFFDVVARYTMPQENSVRTLTETLCRAVNEAKVSKDSWLVMRSVLMGAYCSVAFNRLLDILQEPPRSKSILPATSVLHKVAESDFDPERHTNKTRGAIYLVSMAAWGSSKVESLSMLYSRQSILEALLASVEANQEPIIAHEILLSVDRLLKTSGNTLRFEWTVIITMLQRIAAVMNFSIGPSASFVSQSPKARMVQAIDASETQHEPQRFGTNYSRSLDQDSFMALSRAAMMSSSQKNLLVSSESSLTSSRANPRAQDAAMNLKTCSVELEDLKRVLATMKAMHDSDMFQGLEADFYGLIRMVVAHVPEQLALECFEHHIDLIYPAHPLWLQTLSEVMFSFYKTCTFPEVRVRALQSLQLLLEDYKSMYEQEITDVAVVPFLGDIATEKNAKVWKQGLELLIYLAKHMKCDRFEVILQILHDAAKVEGNEDLRLAAVQALMRLLPAAVKHLPTSRFTALWDKLLGLADQPVSPNRLKSAAADPVKCEILSLLTCMQSTSNYRPKLEIPGEEASVCPCSLAQTSSKQSSSHGGGSEETARLMIDTETEKLSDNVPSGSLGDRNVSNQSSQSASVRCHLDVQHLFDTLLTSITSDRVSQQEFTVCTAGLIRCLQNHFIFDGQDILPLYHLLLERLPSLSWGPTGNNQSSNMKDLDVQSQGESQNRNKNYKAGYHLLGLLLGGWNNQLATKHVRSGIHALTYGLYSAHNSQPGRNLNDSQNPSPAASQPPDPGEFFQRIKCNGEVTLTCLDYLSIFCVIYPDLILEHLPAMLTMAKLLADRPNETTLIIHCLEYMKFVAVKIPGMTTPMPHNMFRQGLDVMIVFINKNRWGGLIANLAGRALSLWWIHTPVMLRAEFIRSVAQPMLLDSAHKEDSMSAIMLDFFLLNDDSSMRSVGLPYNDNTEALFDREGVKKKTYVLRDTCFTIRSTPLGLIDLKTRRATDMRRWVFFAAVGGSGMGSSHCNPVVAIDGLLHLISATLTIRDVSHIEVPQAEAEEEEGLTGRSEEVEAAESRNGSEILSSATPQLSAADKRSKSQSQECQVSPGGQRKGSSSSSALPAAPVPAADCEAPEPDLILMEWRRGPLGEGIKDSSLTPCELKQSDALNRAIRLLDNTPVTLTHKFGVIYIAHGQRTEAEFLANTGGSARYEAFLRGLGHYASLVDCNDDVFTGGLDRSMQKRDGEIALFWRNSLVQCVFFVGTLMPNEAGAEQVNKKRFIGNSHVKVVYTDSDYGFSLDSLSGQFNLVVVLLVPLADGFFRVSVLRAPSVPLIGPGLDSFLVPEESLPMIVRRLLIDADIAAMIASNGDEQYSSNWQERLKQLRLMKQRHQMT